MQVPISFCTDGGVVYKVKLLKWNKSTIWIEFIDHPRLKKIKVKKTNPRIKWEFKPYDPPTKKAKPFKPSERSR